MSETFELRDEAFGDPGGVGAAREKVDAEVLIGNLLLEDVVGGDQDRVRDRNRSDTLNAIFRAAAATP